jgi:protein O-mannosyl-transferase
MTADTRHPLLTILVFPALLLTTGVLVYFNSFKGVFVFDDGTFIVDALELRTLWPPWDAMFGGVHYTRPIAGLTFAVNYAISGLNIWSYHLFNLIIHLIATLALFAVLVITLNRGHYRHMSAYLALVISMLWLVHPLQTESVTYIIQRYESLMGMFFLLSLLSYVLSILSPNHKLLWQAAAILSCYLAVGCKQVAALIPIVIFLYDRTFVTQSFRRTLTRSWRFFLLLLSSWIPLVIIGATAKPFEWAGFDMKVVKPLKFALSEFGVIVHYLKLALWPDPLVFDYFWQLAEKPGEIVPQAMFILILVLLSLWGLVKNHPFGFLGCCFFLLLAPTSSIMPLSDLAADHRMYLPLIPVLTLAILILYSLCQRLPLLISGVSGNGSEDRFSSKLGTLVFTVIVLFMMITFGILTVERNALFSSKEAIWRDTAEKAPHNPRAWANLGNALMEQKRYKEALKPLKKALELKSSYSLVLTNLGFLHSLQNRHDKAIYYWEASLRSRPHHRTYYNLGLQYQLRADKQKAVKNFEGAVEQKPRWGAALIRLAWLYATNDNVVDSKRQQALVMAKRAHPSIKAYSPFYAETLAAAYAANGHFQQAWRTQMEAIRLASGIKHVVIRRVMAFRLKRYQSGQRFSLPSNQIDPTVRIPR